MPALPIARMEEKAAEVADFLMAAANRNRLMVLCHLAEAGELTVNELAGLVRLSQPALSQHLARMAEEGLITARADGRRRFYALSQGPVSDLLAVLQKHFCPPDDTRAAAE
ncbi:metalloregulator ArsR/SmtB family transcription factor [Nisaea acidiphila]|uniref:Metalloregulator ArsR/SmtB family transcription factor n=1 Tax=Nisaea acidiphila TaxID=1862145 RepID=A0A9J7B0T5_9PROT|nr:metalloregulator ArsR/SmtB family transcription factor [Nisaea acidiphila]UUX52084.1 metalloregulator ArsR/SmtB family transcription factor [Nisaea acidiphila]